MNIRFKNKLTRHIPRRRQNKRLCTTERLMMSTLSWPLYKVRVWWFCSFVFTIVLLTISNHSSPALIDCYWMKRGAASHSTLPPNMFFLFFLAERFHNWKIWRRWQMNAMACYDYTFIIIYLPVHPLLYTHKMERGGGTLCAFFSHVSKINWRRKEKIRQSENEKISFWFSFLKFLVFRGLTVMHIQCLWNVMYFSFFIFSFWNPITIFLTSHQEEALNLCRHFQITQNIFFPRPCSSSFLLLIGCLLFVLFVSSSVALLLSFSGLF